MDTFSRGKKIVIPTHIEAHTHTHIHSIVFKRDVKTICYCRRRLKHFELCAAYNITRINAIAV